jgi:hypothetical protein
MATSLSNNPVAKRSALAKNSPVLKRLPTPTADPRKDPVLSRVNKDPVLSGAGGFLPNLTNPVSTSGSKYAPPDPASQFLAGGVKSIGKALGIGKKKKKDDGPYIPAATVAQQLRNTPNGQSPIIPKSSDNVLRKLSGGLIAEGLADPNSNPNAAQLQAGGTLGGALNAGGLRDPAIGALADTAAGKFLDPNFLGSQIEAASAPAIREYRRAIAPSIASEFAASGRTGSGAEFGAFQDANDILSRNIAETAQRSIAGERANQLQAAGFLPSIQQGEVQVGQGQLAFGGELERLKDKRFTRGLQGAEALQLFDTSGEKKKGGIGGAIGTGLGTAVGAYFGGPAGAAAGASIGGSIGNSF